MSRNYTKNQKIFALGLPVVWAILNLLFFRFQFQSTGFIILTALIGGVEIAFLLFPPVYRKIYRGWNWLARKIGQFNSYIILTLIFYLIVTPISLLLRLLGKDLLDRKIDSRATSYWHPRRKEEKNLEDYRKIF